MLSAAIKNKKLALQHSLNNLKTYNLRIQNALFILTDTVKEL